MKVQDKIRAVRQQQDLSQEQVAEMLDLTPQAYSKIEQGKTKLSIDRIQQIANIFNIDITDLISNNDKGIFLLINESSNENSTHSGTIIYNNETDLAHENEKLKLMLSHKDETIEQLKNELETLKEIIALLKHKTAIS